MALEGWIGRPLPNDFHGARQKENLRVLSEGIEAVAGAVAFIDAGQVYKSQTPRLSDLRYGIGVGGRLYTNFGPLRVDVATPINRQPGESRISLYISIGQAF